MEKLQIGEINMLVVNHLSKNFNKIQAVKDVSFHVEKGTTFAFLGTNGAGKSTVIYMIIDLLTPDEGTIEFANDEEVGVVFQSHRLDEELTIEENLIIRAKLYGMSKIDAKKRVDELLKLTHLSNKRDRQYGKCTGGEKRTTDIIRALVDNPSLLILDAPTTGLDADSREESLSILDSLQKEQGLTIFLTTHYIEEAENLDYVLIMHDGEIEVEGTPDELRDQYSRTVLKLHPKNTENLIEVLNKHQFTFEMENENVLLTLLTSTDAIPILQIVEEYIEGFTFREASLEHVFLQVTEQIKSKVKV